MNTARALRSLRVSPMRRRHLKAVLEIEEKVYPRPWSYQLYRRELAMPEDRRIYLVARTDEAVVGYAGLMFAAEDGHVTTVAVDPQYQRQGVGIRVFLVLVKTAIDHGAKHLTLEARVANVGAQALYRRFGFEDAGIRKGYYQATGEDALIMWANDVDTVEYEAKLEDIERSLGDVVRVDRVGTEFERLAV
ncbi:MAG: ribosomal protein S18-alanine N-acetyltransferase [Acidimicrobiia bacterium]